MKSIKSQTVIYMIIDTLEVRIPPLFTKNSNIYLFKLYINNFAPTQS